MKTLKLDHQLAELVLAGKKTSTWRLFDDKDLSVNDEVSLIDKVDASDPDTWKVIGTATIHKIVEVRLGDISKSDSVGHEQFASKEAMLAQYQAYYGRNVSLQTPVKLLFFTFSPRALFANEGLHAKTVVIYADGASRGNPGPSASGYVIYDDRGTLLNKRGEYLGVTTNNQAEYTALKLGLEEAKSLGAREVSVYMDSLLVINQMKGIFKVKNRDLWPIHDTLKALCKGFAHVTFTQIPRELNKLADGAANEVLDVQEARTTGTRH
jgi:ribonuclease HI